MFVYNDQARPLTTQPDVVPEYGVCIDVTIWTQQSEPLPVGWSHHTVRQDKENFQSFGMPPPVGLLTTGSQEIAPKIHRTYPSLPTAGAF